jgi:DnaJ-class molecular chaperone
LHTEINITLKEALLGFSTEIRHLDDHIVLVDRDSVIQPGEIIRIKGEGMPKHQTSDKGDLFVKVNVNFPNSLTEKQIESI